MRWHKKSHLLETVFEFVFNETMNFYASFDVVAALVAHVSNCQFLFQEMFLLNV